MRGIIILVGLVLLVCVAVESGRGGRRGERDSEERGGRGRRGAGRSGRRSEQAWRSQALGNQYPEEDDDDLGQQSVNPEDFSGIVPARHYQTESPLLPTPEKYVRDEPEIEIPAGKIIGKTIQLTTGKTVYAFLGIPFAKPPIGELRFKPPVSISKFEGTIDASNLPNSCVQPNWNTFGAGFRGEEMWNPNTNVSEDCLYLNIWVPEEVYKKKEAKIASVLFWIYGGGFFSGSNTLDEYNGAYLASEENLIFVSTQYRLGPLGFLYFGTDDAPGNAGLWDQNMALKFTHENIKHFGGNKDSITLIGESAGSVSVSLHLLSKESKPFFKRGVMMSAVPTETEYSFIHPKTIRQRSYKLAQLVGCNVRQPLEETMKCLREKDAKLLTQHQFGVTQGKMLDYGFKPTLDGHFFDDYPANIINNGEAKRSDLIIGSVEDEGSFFVLYQYLKYFKHDRPTSISRDRYLEIMRDIFGDFSELEQRAILDFYTNWENPEDGYVNQRRISDAVGDYFFTCPIRKFADVWSNRGLNVYYFHLTHRSSVNPWDKWMGVMHGDDIPFMLGHPLNASTKYTQKEKQLSKMMTKTLGNFAKTGVPSENWARYTSEEPIYLDFNATIVSDKSTPNQFGPHADACVLWNKFLPLLRRHTPKRKQGFRNGNHKRRQMMQHAEYFPSRGFQGSNWENRQINEECLPHQHHHSSPVAQAVPKSFGQGRVVQGGSTSNQCQMTCNHHGHGNEHEHDIEDDDDSYTPLNV